MIRNLSFSTPRVLLTAAALMAAVATLFAAGAVQQAYRQSANDPQIQLAEDTAAALNANRPVASLIPAVTVNMRTSLAPFVIVLNKKYHVVASSGRLDGVTPTPPSSALLAASEGQGKDTAQAHESRITWQPAPGVREAAVIVSYHDGYVVAARSLSEVEQRESRLLLMAFGALIGIGVVGAAAQFALK